MLMSVCVVDYNNIQRSIEWKNITIAVWPVAIRFIVVPLQCIDNFKMLTLIAIMRDAIQRKADRIRAKQKQNVRVCSRFLFTATFQFALEYAGWFSLPHGKWLIPQSNIVAEPMTCSLRRKKIRKYVCSLSTASPQLTRARNHEEKKCSFQWLPQRIAKPHEDIKSWSPLIFSSVLNFLSAVRIGFWNTSHFTHNGGKEFVRV